jgi:hypothetical protein
MTTKRKALVSAIVVGALGSLVALGVFGLFSATTQNAGNEISSGTVVLADNDAGSSMFNITGAKPGDSWTRCIKVTYSGSLPAPVRFYYTNSSELAKHLHMTVTQGTQASTVFPSCSGFAPDATGVIFNGSAYSAVPGSWETGIHSVQPDGFEAWHPGDELVFEFTLTLDPATPDSLQNATTGSTTIVWEARNS